MNKNLTELVFILDRSGSMHGLEDDTIGGFNSFIEKQKDVDGQCLVSTVLFNQTSKVIYDRASLKEIKEMTGQEYVPSGSTALIDAMGDSITHLHQYINEEDNVLVTIITDGYENSSVEWNHQRVTKLVEDLKKRNWLFTYIGANQDALAVARDMGIDHSMNFMADAAGTKAMFMKEKRSRSALYNKLAKGKSFFMAKSEDYFEDENLNDE